MSPPQRRVAARTPSASSDDAPPLARIALGVLHSLSAHVASWHADAEIRKPATVERAESANKWIVLALAGTSAFMTSLDSSIVNIALPSIAHGFRVPLSGSVEWVLDGYLVVVAATLLTFGRLADMLGRKPLLLGGLALFTLGSVLCGAAPSLGVLIAARCFQGLGAAAIYSVNIAMVTRAFSAEERGRALGINMVIVALGISLGPTVGGILTSASSWRWIFYVNLPIGAIVILAAWRALTERRRVERQHFDLVGATLLAVGIGAVTLALSFGQEWGWASFRFLAVEVLGVSALALTALVERRAPAPILSRALLRNRVFVFANVSFVMTMLALFSIGFLLPFYFEEVRGFSTLQSGLLLTPLSLTLAAVAPLSGTFADRVGWRWQSPLGLAIACAGLLLLSTLNPSSPILYIILCLIVAGIGQALFTSPNSKAMMGTARPSEQGVASGMLATGRTIGQGLSVAVAGTVFTSWGGAAAGSALVAGRGILGAAQVQALQHTFVSSLHAAFVVCAALAAIGVVTATARGE
jgi:EmrB/QacA subfamily drug resistance transporter